MGIGGISGGSEACVRDSDRDASSFDSEGTVVGTGTFDCGWPRSLSLDRCCSPQPNKNVTTNKATDRINISLLYILCSRYPYLAIENISRTF